MFRDFDFSQLIRFHNKYLSSPKMQVTNAVTANEAASQRATSTTQDMAANDWSVEVNVPSLGKVCQAPNRFDNPRWIDEANLCGRDTWFDRDIITLRDVSHVTRLTVGYSVSDR